ncbi:MAG: radical SAM protein, partial [Phycisphaerales bacterium]|nr:radical SAM protein [Phycisphaerales bacterium]
PPSPLGMTSRQWVDAVGPRVKGGRLWAHRAYKAFMREGRSDDSVFGEVGEPRVGPVLRNQTEDNPEGVITKFIQQLDVQRKGVDLEAESVLIPMIGRKGHLTHSLCVSSQVGCAMGCGFCETAQMGLMASLTPAQIVGQWHAAKFQVGIAPTNLVFMGMGEPLDNTDAVLQAIAVLTDQAGAAMAMSKITVSTVGRLDGLRRLREAVKQPGWHRLGVSISLNAPNDDIRNQIMPVNRGMPMGALREALLDFPHGTGKPYLIAYVLIPGLNDAMEHADELAEWVKPLRCMVNVIPYNPRRDSPWEAPHEEDVEQFVQRLSSHGVFVKRRRTKGRSTMAACGQLGNPGIRRRKIVGPLTPLTVGGGS